MPAINPTRGIFKKICRIKATLRWPRILPAPPRPAPATFLLLSLVFFFSLYVIPFTIEYKQTIRSDHPRDQGTPKNASTCCSHLLRPLLPRLAALTSSPFNNNARKMSPLMDLSEPWRPSIFAIGFCIFLDSARTVGGRWFSFFFFFLFCISSISLGHFGTV